MPTPGESPIGMSTMLKTLVAAAAALALSAGAASAAVTITDANVPGNPEENIQLTQDTPGTTILGVTNQTNTSVSFVGDEMLNAPAQGQARIVAVDGGFSYLEIFLTNPNLGFTALELNINALADGMANFYAYSLSNVLLASPMASFSAGWCSTPRWTSSPTCAKSGSAGFRRSPSPAPGR
jgi:ABC-type glycerol-3-phosphate transport system substrate-binding protein